MTFVNVGEFISFFIIIIYTESRVRLGNKLLGMVGRRGGGGAHKSFSSLPF